MNLKLLRNCLCLVVANVDPKAQNFGLAKLLIERAKLAGREAGFSQMIAPVRPSHFHEVQRVSFDDYVELRRADGQLQDPWMRAHERAGAVKLNVYRRSTTVTATIKKWSEWTNTEYLKSGSYELKRGLADLQIDREKDVGVYTEPNVWFRYRL